MKVQVKVTQSCLTLCDPWVWLTDCIVLGILQARILEWVTFPFSRGFSQPRDRTQVSHIADALFTSWATGKPRNTGMGCYFLLQRIFPTQGSNLHLLQLLHCRWILYQLSYQGSPWYCQPPHSNTAKYCGPSWGQREYGMGIGRSAL